MAEIPDLSEAVKDGDAHAIQGGLTRRMVLGALGTLGAAQTRAAVGVSALLLPGNAGKAAQSRMSVSLLQYLTPPERAVILGGGDPGTIAQRINEAMLATPEGATIDATMLRGEIELATDPFAGVHAADRTLITGAVTFIRDMQTRGGIELPSKLTWRWEGTRLRARGRVTNWPGRYNQGAGLLETRLWTGTASGVKGKDTVTVDDGSPFHPGMVVALAGLEPFANIQHPVVEAMTVSKPARIRFRPAAAMTIGDSIVFVRIDDEIIKLLVARGGASATVQQRGALGTTAAAHAAGATATLMAARVATVLAVDGNTLTLDRAHARSFTAAPWWAGTIDTRIEGWGEIDGGYDRNFAITRQFSGVLSTLSRNFTMTGGFTVRRASFAGMFLQYPVDATVEIKTLSHNGGTSLSNGGGGSLWFFGGGMRSSVTIEQIESAYLGVVMDAKSSNVTELGLVYGQEACSVRVLRCISHAYPVELSGSTGCRVVLDYDESANGPYLNRSGAQVTAPLPLTDNFVQIGKANNLAAYANSVRVANPASNTVIVNGQRGRVIESTITDAGNRSLGASSTTYMNATLIGSKVTDRFSIMPQTDLPAGVSVFATRPTGANGFRIGFGNTHTSARTITGPTTYVVRAEGPWNQ